MASKKYHHLYKRGGVYYFRKDGIRFSLETTISTEAARKRDKLLENYRLYGQFTSENHQERKTFGQVAKEWAQIHQKIVKYSTWRDYRSAMNTHVLPAFKDMPIKDIAYLDVEGFKTDMDCGSKRVNNILVPMRSVFNIAFKQGYVDENVMLKVDNLPVDQPDIYPFTYDEVLSILEATDEFYRPYTAIRFFTGMRSGESDGLEWADYKEDMIPNNMLHINKSFVYGEEGKTKTKKSKRYIDCIAPTLKALEEQKGFTGKQKYIFLTKDGNRMSPDHFRNVVWRPALLKAGLTYRPPIQTRHTFATMMLSAGEDIGWIQNMLGHSSLQMIYTRYYSWIPKKTRKDGSAFLKSIEAEQAEGDVPVKENQGKVVSIFDRNDTKTTHPPKKSLRP